MASHESTICINPGTGKKIGEYPLDTIDDLNEIVKRARKAQTEWALLPVSERIKKVNLVKNFIIDNMDKISAIISDDNGKTRLDALATEVFPAVLAVDYYCNNAKKFLKPRKLKQSSIMFFNKSSKIIRIPYGVVGIISPWNYPYAIPFSEVIMGLLAGNAIMLKTASETQVVGHILKESIEYAKLPEGIFNYINMPGRIVGDAFLDAGINKIFFTGSTGIGKYLMEKASKTLTPLVLELGGKDPMIVCDDANLERAANGALWAGLQNSGQSCGAVERIYVDEKVYEPFLKLLKEKIEILRVGRDTGFNVDIGSMTTKKQLDTVKAHLDDALKKGAKIYAQSDNMGDSDGLFIPCYVLTNVNHDMLIMKEETFGPVLGVMPYKDIQEAIRLANDSIFGLTGSVWSQDKKKAEDIAKQVKAGAITINDHLMSHGMSETPWGGFNESGIGRTHGEIGFDEMTQPQVIVHESLSFAPKNMWWYPAEQSVYDGLKGGLIFLKGKGLINKIRGMFALIKIFPRMFKK